MSPLETPGHVERLAKRLNIAARDIAYLSERLRWRGWEDSALEDLSLARADLRQAIELLTRHARHWRRGYWRASEQARRHHHRRSPTGRPGPGGGRRPERS